jgi:hypothetical protein
VIDSKIFHAGLPEVPATDENDGRTAIVDWSLVLVLVLKKHPCRAYRSAGPQPDDGISRLSENRDANITYVCG